MNKPTITFIGGGNMASSLIGGLLAGGWPTSAITASAPSQATRQRLAEDFGISVTADNTAAAARAGVVVLAVKPQVLPAVCRQLADGLAHNPLILSIAAGVTTTAIDHWLGGGRAIVRCMPNTPVQLGCGASGVYANETVSAAQRALCQRLLESVGTVDWLADEELMNAVTAVAGSGPALYYWLVEQMEVIGSELGLPPQIARNLAMQTLTGAGRMVAESPLAPNELRSRVTSKNGTTERLISILQNKGLENILRQAVTGARDRSRELSDESES